MSYLQENVTGLLALYGAILGTISTVISVVLAVNELNKSRRAIQVYSGMKDIPPVLVFESSQGSSSDGVFVKVLNNGPRPIEVTLVGLTIGDGRVMTHEKSDTSAGFPKKLEFAESVELVFACWQMEELLKDAKRGALFTSALAIDAEGRKYSAKLPKSLKLKGLAK